MNVTPRTSRDAIYRHAVACETALARAYDAESPDERAEYQARAERRAEAALAWARVLPKRVES